MAGSGVLTHSHLDRWRRAAAIALVGSATLYAGAEAARAAAGPEGVRQGRNITVFHNIDMVAVFGHAIGTQTQVDVFRGGHRIATVRAPAISTPEGGGLEINHGPETTAQPGDCWVGATPDIRPGDRIVVSNPGGAAGVDEAIVDNITIDDRRVVTRDADTGGPVVVVTPAVSDDPATTDVDETAPAITEPTREEVWVQGAAEYIDENGDATPIPVSALDSPEFLGVPLDNQLRMAPNEVIEGPVPGTYIARYWDANPAQQGAGFNIERNRNGHGDAAIFNFLATGEGHAIGYGHTEVVPPVAMLVDGLGEQADAAPGCEAAPKHPSSAGVTSVDALNLANAGPDAADDVLTVGGWLDATVLETDAQLVLGNGAATVSKALAPTAGPGQKGWSVSFTKAELEALPQGTLTAQLSIGGVPAGAAKTIAYDTVAPDKPTASPGPGSHEAGTEVRLAAEDGARIHYTTDGSAPGASSERYTFPVRITAATTIRAIAIDAAGNASEVSTLGFTVLQPRGPIRIVEPPRPIPPPVVRSLPGLDVTTPSPALRVAGMTVGSSRLSVSSARRRGITARFVTPAGARYVEARLLKVGSDGKRRVVSRKLMAAAPGRRQLARFTGASIRRKLGRGRYVLEVRAGKAPTRMGTAATRLLRITA